ncbi:RNA polymerase sigma-70 factor (ECF subfamily) [Nocardia transvalensis]|uniref:RNA polymerase sigma-70 factor (ECF subfamily) n=1 Tax=Nocardia transvalensis TaxID=37333 RepID=A0A7W9UGC4_9NOCA|nr:RNA polymerase sigma factor SigJ [Nocardia transvalensis]MBB5912138.1 RNA polymerase sigma-70 factor (ECF subfamily) [Nocardia transvalensis]
MTGSAEEDATRVFADHRELLFSVVYNMLASVADTEDVLQETWLAWVSRNSPGGDEIEHPRAYLVRIAINQALARRAAISRRRETYVGPWLPEPLVAGDAQTGDSADAAEIALRSESVSMAMLVVLETLSPLERAVFVLHDVFGYSHTDIAGMLHRSDAAIRQLAHRAREHVHARRPRRQADPRTQRRVTEKFLVTSQRGDDLAGLLELLAPDVTLWSDGGGKRRAALRPVEGRERILRLIANPGLLQQVPALEIGYRLVNGDPAAVLFSDGVPFTVVVLDIDPATELIRGIYAVSNPDKLAHITTRAG